MAKSYGDDLRRKLLQAHDRGEDTLEQLSVRFEVSVSWAWKISAQRISSGQMERIGQQRGNRPKVTSEVEQRLRSWIEEQPGMMLAQLQEKL
jgi:transposase